MSTDDRERWNRRWSEGSGREVPDAFVLRALALLGPGAGRRALDLASGAGRHALELARRGWRVAAWDVSEVALARVADRAAAEGLAIDTRAVDLELPAALHECAFDLVLVVDYLDRALFSDLARSIAPGGHALVRAFTRDWPGPKPGARHRLAAGELARGLPGLDTVLALEQGGRAGLLARRPSRG
jgi:SAM-dependent methyltransferase